MRRAPDAAALAAARNVAARLDAGEDVARSQMGAAVRTTLSWLAHAHPGKLVEVRVPPFGAVQVGVRGQASAHTRGTPPNVIETDAATWLALATGRLSWPEALATHRVSASGARANLAHQLAPVIRALAT